MINIKLIVQLIINIKIFIILMLFSSVSFAWNAMGHRVIGEIAYERLTPKTKIRVDQLIDYLSNAYPYSSSFQTANAWADYLKQDNVHAFDSWHYIDTPLSPNNVFAALPQENNLLWALRQAANILKNPASNQYEKALFLRFLLHFTEDAHQPLHCINYFSKDFPQGDKGGNLIRISQNRYHNLHAYWDDGAGILNEKCGFLSSKKRKAVCLAHQFQKNYPESFFNSKILDLNPEHWISQSYETGKTFAYQPFPENVLSDSYTQQAQQISEQQIALAGYRLAGLLNNLFN